MKQVRFYLKSFVPIEVMIVTRLHRSVVVVIVVALIISVTIVTCFHRHHHHRSLINTKSIHNINKKYYININSISSSSSSMMMMSGGGDSSFVKYHGLGNDFILVDNRYSSTPIYSSTQSIKLCNRNFGIGGDGVIFVLPGTT